MLILGPKIDNARHGVSQYGPVVMDQPSRNTAGTVWARLRIGDATAHLWLDDGYMSQWHGLIDLPCGTRLVCIDPDNWTVTW